MSVLSKTDSAASEINPVEFESAVFESAVYESAVLIDTNGFMIPIQFGIDIFSELKRLGFSQFLTVPAVIYELDKLSRTVKGNDKTAVRIARRLSERCRIINDFGSDSGGSSGSRVKYADDVIIESALKYSVAVLTNDSVLRQKLMQKGIRVVSMRQTNRLDFIHQK